MAHDFNNILMIVNSYSALLESQVEADSTVASFIEKIQGAVWRGQRLTRQLLAYSPEHEGIAEVLDINEIITEMDQFFGRVLEADITIELELSPDIGNINADVGRIEQVMMNLVVNARDAMPNGGQLTIRTREEQLQQGQTPPTLQPGRYVVIQVEDTGVGMDEDTRARIFEPFYTTKGKDRGTGLGLATVYGIVHSYDGYIGVDSEPGRGSRFTLYLPVNEADEPTEGFTEQLAGAVQREAEETILLVEDEDDVREPLRHALADGGFTVLEASSGDEAVQIARDHQEQIDLLVSDVVLPGISGVDVADKIVGVQPNLKVIFISGYTGDVLERKQLEPGRMLISKPFDIERLIHTVREVLDE